MSEDLTASFKAAMRNMREKRDGEYSRNKLGFTIEGWEKENGLAMKVSEARRRESGQIEVGFRFFRLSGQKSKHCGGLQVSVPAERGRTPDEEAYLECRKAVQQVGEYLTRMASLALLHTSPEPHP